MPAFLNGVWCHLQINQEFLYSSLQFTDIETVLTLKLGVEYLTCALHSRG